MLGGRLDPGTRAPNPARGLLAATAVTLLGGLVPLGLVLATPRSASAQGFGLYEHGTCAMARAGATVAEPCDDGSSLFYNPAGLADADGWTISAGATVVAAHGGFDSDTGDAWDLENDPIPVPHAFGTWGVRENLGVGLGVFFPYVLGTEWPTDDFPGRFLGYDNGLTTAYVQPTVAYRPAPWISVGGGIDVAVGTVTLNQRLDLSQQNIAGGITGGALGIPYRTEFADVGVESDVSLGMGAHVGVQVRPTERVTLGARYLSQVEMEYESDADFTQITTGLTIPTDLSVGGTTIPAGTSVDDLLAPRFQAGQVLGDQSVTSAITMPDQVVAGVAYRPTDRFLVEVDWQWVNWEDFDELVIEFENAPDETRVEDFRNTNGVRLGAEYVLREDVAIRGGYLFHQAAAPDRTVTPLLPDAERNEITLGLGWTFRPDARIDVSYQFLGQDERRGRVRDPRVGEELSADLNSGVYSFGAHLLGTSLTWRF